MAKAPEKEETILPDADMFSDSEDEVEMKFLDNLAESKQVEKLERERKRRLENTGEDFEQNKRRFVT